MTRILAAAFAIVIVRILTAAPDGAQVLSYEVVHRFQASAQAHVGLLVTGSDGMFYGVASDNPPAQDSVFRFDPAGTVTTLRTVNGVDGSHDLWFQLRTNEIGQAFGNVQRPDEKLRDSL